MVFDEALSDIGQQALIFLPMTVLYAKITPSKIEATCFALLASASNFAGIGGAWLGSWINNQFVGITKDNLEDYWKLLCITYVCGLIPFTLRFWLIPSNKEIEDLQARIKTENPDSPDKVKVDDSKEKAD